jgi:hypothetical protein
MNADRPGGSPSGDGARAEIAWSGGGTASIDAIDGDRVELVSTRAFAPGSRPEGTLMGALRENAESPREVAAGQPIWLKIHGARRQEDGSFRVKGRLLNVRREVLHLLKEIVPGPNGGKSSTP